MKKILKNSLIALLLILFTSIFVCTVAFATDALAQKKHFSSVDAAKKGGMVAKIGSATSGYEDEVYFSSLTNAVSAANNGDTIYMLCDISSHKQTVITGKSLKIVGEKKYTVTSADKKPFLLYGGGSLTLENLAFENCSNFITLGNGELSSPKDYTLSLKNVSVSFTASGAIYAYNANLLDITLDGCTINAGASGNALINAGGVPGSTTIVKDLNFTLTDTGLNELCSMLASNMSTSITGGFTRYALNEFFSSDQKAKEAGVLLNSDGTPFRIGDKEGGKVGEVYFRSPEQYYKFVLWETAESTASKLTINKNSAYSVVYYDDTHYATGTSTGVQAGHDYMGASRIANAIFGNTNNLKKYSEATSGKKIYVGIVDKTFVKPKLEGIGHNEFAIIVENGDVYLLAWHDKALKSAIDTFVGLIDNGAVTLPASGTYKFKADLKKPWVLDFTKPAGLSVDSSQYVNDDSLQYLFYGTLNDYYTYVEALLGEGYTEVWRNTIGENEFTLLKNENKGHALYVAYNDFTYESLIKADDAYRTEFKKCIRVVASPLGSITLPDESVNTYNDYTKKITGDSFITAVGVDSPGTSYIIALEDGRFIVVDGGASNAGETLWDALKAAYKRAYGKDLAAGNKIHIAAWYLTHAHGDHWGAFYTMVGNHASQLKIDYMISNGIDEYSISLEEGQQTVFMSSDLSYITTMQQKVGGFKFIKVHTGQRLYFANVTLEVLMTFEDHLPVPTTNSNDTNTIIRMNVKTGFYTSSVLFLGDSHINAGRYIVASYGGYLKSDIVTLAHHGNVGVEDLVYKMVAAKMVLVPNLHSSLSSYFHSNSTAYHVLANKKAMEICEYLWFSSSSGTLSTLDFTSRGPNYLTAVTYNGSKYIKKASGVAAPSLRKGYEATCTKPGMEDYWIYMGRYFADEACTELIVDLDAWKQGDGQIRHTLTKIAGKAASTEEDGWMDHYKCSCGKYYLDAECKTEIDDLGAWKLGDGRIAKLEKKGCKSTVSFTGLALCTTLAISAVYLDKKKKQHNN